MSPKDTAGPSKAILLRARDVVPEVTIEPMTVEAADVLGPALAVIDPWARYGHGASNLSAFLGASEPGAPRYVVRLGHDVAGAIGIRENWLRGPYLQFLGFLPAHQRHGLGQLTLAWFEGTARARGDRNLWVAASDFNTGAIRFYERLGFVRTANLEGLLRDDSKEILCRKRL